MEKKILKREEVDQKYTWNLTDIYASEEDFENDLDVAKRIADMIVDNHKGKIKTSEDINKALDLSRNLMEILTNTMTYAHLYVSVDHSNSENQARLSKTSNILSELQSKVSFLENEIMDLDKDILEETVEKSKENRHFIKNLLRKKPYSLDPEVERVLLSLSDIMDAPYDIYNQAKLADMDFGTFKVDGNDYPLALRFSKKNMNMIIILK